MNDLLLDFRPLRSHRFWQKMFIYFWIFSIFGHYLEVFWTMIPMSGTWRPIMESVLPIAAPYGIGAVTLIILVWPFAKNNRTHPIIIYILCTIVASAVEYLSALFVIVTRGHNQFWSYSNHPYNLNGYISLDSSLVLGIIATLFLYFVYPNCEKIINKIKWRWLNVAFWIMLVSYLIDLSNSYLK